ncbi:hypothetical protein AMTRI_Chr03g143390 [Amborella trichopoda]
MHSSLSLSLSHDARLCPLYSLSLISTAIPPPPPPPRTPSISLKLDLLSQSLSSLPLSAVHPVFEVDFYFEAISGMNSSFSSSILNLKHIAVNENVFIHFLFFFELMKCLMKPRPLKD